MWCGIISIFPEMFSAIENFGITRRAIDNGLLTLKKWHLRDFADNTTGNVDDKPFGGAPGMLLSPKPLFDAINAAKSVAPSSAKVVYLSPAGEKLTQKVVKRLVGKAEPLIFVSGRYKGIDHRIVEKNIDYQLSIGDYIITGGELAAMVVIDAMARLLPDALGDIESAKQDAFSQEDENLLDCPHYTRPAEFNGIKVPDVLLSGDHKKIANWRLKQVLGQTWLHRNKNLKQTTLDATSKRLLTEFIAEYEENDGRE